MRSTLVETRYGTVAGRRAGPVIQWRGVPYAAPPVGARRFRPPEPPDPWVGPRDATRWPPAAPQAPSKLMMFGGGQRIEWSEDCLYLNIFAPFDADGLRPVMVWIHGGGFVGGSGSMLWYDGSTFAAGGDAVVVTLNYRLGVLGFLHLGEVAGEQYPSSGNCGILDQLAALRWVRDNIAGFGGDPSAITVFGESAGAMSIGTMLAMPAAAGLFDRAILQSGSTSAHCTRDQADRITANVLRALDATVACLPHVAVPRILEAQVAVTEGSDAAGYLAFRPVIDGISLPELPSRAIAAGSARQVPVLIGTNADEMTLFLAFDASVTHLTEEQLQQRVARLVGQEAASRLSADYRHTRPGGDPAARLATIMTDLVFRVPAIRVAEAQARHDAPVWMYRFDWASPLVGGRLGATHGLDIPFVWNVMDRRGVVLFTGARRARHALARATHAAWVAFATSGNPGTPLLPDWPGYEPSRRATMILDATRQVMDDPRGDERELWSGLL